MKRIFAWLLVACALVSAGSVLAQEDTKPESKPDSAPAAAVDAAPAGATAAAPEASAKKDDDHGHSHSGGDDLTHGNASSALHQVEEVRFDQAIATFVIFLLLAGILAKFAWGPIVEGLDKRESGIAKMIDDARLAQEQAEAQLRSYEAKLAAATEEARTMVAQARADAEAAKDRIQNEAKELAAKERAKAIGDITAAKNAALQQIAEKSVNTAISLASSIVKREVKPEDHDRLVSDALGQFSKLN